MLLAPKSKYATELRVLLIPDTSPWVTTMLPLFPLLARADDHVWCVPLLDPLHECQQNVMRRQISRCLRAFRNVVLAKVSGSRAPEAMVNPGTRYSR